MPPKQPNHIRAWGTRYDTLPSSPPLSPEARRDQGQSAPQDSSISLDSHARSKEEKQPHDASVFVGSLPSNVDQTELTRMLTTHLSEHTEIKGIKVVRDSKGGVCAFVQCENASSASVLLQSLQSSPPKPFLGRILRYEPARAFRTLLVSYRMPSQAIIPEGINDLPDAIRIWKPKNTKYHRIVYNGEAVEAQRFSGAHIKDEVFSTGEAVVYLHPLKFDAEAILNMARYFGPLEKFSNLTIAHELVKGGENGFLTPDCYPPPHNAARSKCMDTGCWEIKWEHRDDCVAALMALRRVPHLSVSWAHQPQSQHIEQRHIQGYQCPLNHVQSRVQSKMARFQTCDSPSFAIPLESTSFINGVSSNPSQSTDFQDNSRSSSKSVSPFGVTETRAWADPVTPPGAVQNNHQTDGSPNRKSQHLDTALVRRIDWAETDFPSFTDFEYDSKLDWSAWGETTFERDFKTTSIITSQSVCEISTPQRSQISPPLLQANEISSTMSPQTPRRAFSQVAVTPISQTFSTPISNAKPKANGLGHSAGREFDPTTLFIGGLEAYGPRAWTEEKVHAVFGRFGGLEYVRFVQPPNGTSAFAFVKYDNRSSPAQAIMEEHNRVYAGRTLKVQLRDINPPRSPWKHNRGRGRFSHYPSSRKVMLSNQRASHTSKQEELFTAGQSPDTDRKTETVVPALIPDTVDKETDENLVELSVDKQPQEGPMARLMEVDPGEKYREWYDAPGAAASPEQGNIPNGPTGPPLTAPAITYPVPPGYYPVPWLPYPPQPGHYQMSYYGPYPAYPLPGAPVPPYTTPPGSETSGPAAGNHPWPGLMYNAYPPYFGAPRPGPEQQNPPATSLSPQSAQVCQAPLAPSGFIQNDQGTLIAVYPPDALDQYMSEQSGSNGSNPSTSTQSITTTTVCPSSQTPPGSISTYSVPQVGGNPPRIYPVPTNPIWNPVPQPFPPMPPMPPGLIAGPATPTYNVNAATCVGDHRDHIGNSSSANFGKKQNNRKDFHQQNGNRSSRTFNPRNGRGHIHHQDLTGNTEGVNSHYRNSQFVNNPDWSQYTRR